MLGIALKYSCVTYFQNDENSEKCILQKENNPSLVRLNFVAYKSQMDAPLHFI